LFIESYSAFDEAAAEVALTHHENWDGTGYPGHVDILTGEPRPGREGKDGKARGRKEDEIPLFGRIVRVADVYDALCSKRAYKEPIPEEKVLKIIENDAGTSFDPDMVVTYDCQD